MIKEIKNKNGTTVYRENIYLGIDSITGKPVNTSITAKTKRDLEKKKRDKFKDFESNGYTRRKAIKIDTYEELANKWFNHYKETVTPQTVKNTRVVLDKYLIPNLGHYKIKHLSVVLIQDFTDKMSKETSSRYILANTYNKSIIKYACQLRLLLYNPYDCIIKPKKENKKKKEKFYLDNDEVKQFLNALDQLSKTYKNNLYSTLFRFLLATGVRIGEAIALKWSDIYLENGVVYINKSYVNGQYKIGKPKTKSGYRDITIDNKTLLELKQHRMRQMQYYNEIGVHNDVVFSFGLPEYLTYSTIIRNLKRVTEKTDIPFFTCHAFRHTHASILLNAGVGYKEISHRLGHANISMTLNLYAHLSKDRDKETAEIFENAMAIL